PETVVQQGDDRKILELVVTKPQDTEAFIAKVDYLYQHPDLASRDEIILKDGRTLDRYTVSVCSFEGNYYGRVWYFRDISEVKAATLALQASSAQIKQKASQLEKTLLELQYTQVQLIQSEKMSSLGQLVAGIAHEINNPVNFIYGNLTHVTEYIQELMHLLKCYQQEYSQPSLALQIISEEIDCNFLMADLSRLLSSMKVGAERIRSIILSLRTFSRLDEADLKAVNLHEGIESALLFLQSRLKTKAGKEIQVIKEYGDLPPVECYPGKLNQVFMNVLCNAIDALELGSNNQSPTILLRTWVQGQRVAIAIADNGVGISESIRERIFEPFFTTKPIGQGTGIGLSISYQVVVEKHGGSFKFTSELGQGTEFLIEIPLSQN
ncbi:MAG: HAMP domain-containing histidine kinase, partial [Nostocaceae cyanobacterium]|nr:HAMP domain-containing histidine kinase [Nostocaceae cyanobacterium]